MANLSKQRHERIAPDAIIHPSAYVGDDVVVESGAHIGPNASVLGRTDALFLEKPAAIIKEKSVIGANAVVAPGVTVGARAVVGAGSVVTHDVPPLAIVVGNPARIVDYAETKHAQGAPPVSATGIMPTAVKGVVLHHLKYVHDLRGDLSVGEFSKEIPFRPSRYFLVFNVPSAKTRGEHAHHRCEQFLVCVKGACAVVADDGTSREEFDLNGPTLGLYLPPMTWGIQYKYSSDAVLLVFASHEYDATDYIRDYDEFVALVSARK
jgi:UDP-2-acetamido-3-amino-2,3-dideoxy-glucuronate N-acetyltransferase